MEPRKRAGFLFPLRPERGAPVEIRNVRHRVEAVASNVAADTVHPAGSIFSAPGKGVLAAAAFVTGSVARCRRSHPLRFGHWQHLLGCRWSRHATAVQFAKVTAGIALTRNHVIVEVGLDPQMAAVFSFCAHEIPDGDLSAPAESSPANSTDGVGPLADAMIMDGQGPAARSVDYRLSPGASLTKVLGSQARRARRRA